MLSMNAPFRKGTYVVVKAFRFRGRNFIDGMEFNARRLDVPKGRLDKLYRDGYIELPDEEEDEAYREQRQEAMDSHEPPAPKEIEPLPVDDEDFEE